MERMNEHDHNHQSQEGQDHILVHHDHKPYWKRVHHTLIFWVFLFLMLVAIIYYAMTVDFSLAPHRQLKGPEKNRTS
jgi:hypothetical protein